MLTAFLRSRLAIIDETHDIEEALDLVKFYDYDAILLRLSEESLGEVEIMRKLRLARVRAPIAAIARSLNEAARLRVLQAGADDLIVDALSHEEVFMKIQNLIRRSRGFQENALRIGAVEINMNAKKIYARGKPVTLTKKEYQIAEILALRKGVVLSKEAILDHLYGGLDEAEPEHHRRVHLQNPQKTAIARRRRFHRNQLGPWLYGDRPPPGCRQRSTAHRRLGRGIGPRHRLSAPRPRKTAGQPRHGHTGLRFSHE